MKKAGTDKAKVRDAIESTKGYVGVSGIYTMTPEDHCGLGVDSMVMITVKDGTFKLAE
jgi:branched-chain amino acid transport system substrate-binding protein